MCRGVSNLDSQTVTNTISFIRVPFSIEKHTHWQSALISFYSLKCVPPPHRILCYVVITPFHTTKVPCEKSCFHIPCTVVETPSARARPRVD